jgi:hypothetical protein
VRAEHGRDAVGPFYEAIGTRIFDTSRDVDPLSASDLGPRGRRGGSRIKRSLRERPQLASFGVDPASVGKEEDWHGGSRRTKK